MPVPVEFFDHRSTEDSQGAADATPKFVAKFGPVPQGYIWYVEVITSKAQPSGAHTAILQVFTSLSDAPDLVNFSSRLDFAAAAQDQVRDYVNPRIVKPGEYLLVVLSGGTLAQSDQCAVSCQIAWCLTNATSGYGSLNWREELSLHEQEMTGQEQRKDAVVVGGSGWVVGELETPEDIVSNAFTPWASRDPADAADNPAQPTMPPGIGQYVGGNELGPQRPQPPYDGRILPDGSTEGG